MNDNILFEIPDFFFTSLKDRILLGLLPSEKVKNLLTPILYNFNEIFPQLPIQIQNEIKSILQIYPEIAEEYIHKIAIDIKPDLIKTIIASFNKWAANNTIRMAAASFSTSEQNIKEGNTDNESVSWTYISSPDGQHEVRLSSKHIELAGATITLKVGPIIKTSKFVLLGQGHGQYVYTEISFTAEEWETIPLNIQFEILDLEQ